MGYRHYFHRIKKSFVEKIQNCNNQEDLYNLFLENGLERSKYDADEDDESYYCPLYKINEPCFEFGKYYENSEELYKIGKPLFLSKELSEYYEDYLPIYGGEEMILSSIEWHKQHIIKMYENLVNNTFENEYEKEMYCEGMTDEEIHLKRLLNHCKDYLRWWQPKWGDYSAIDLNKSKDSLVDSWLYEHTIFDLVRLYKDFDNEKEYILFFGW